MRFTQNQGLPHCFLFLAYIDGLNIIPDSQQVVFSYLAKVVFVLYLVGVILGWIGFAKGKHQLVLTSTILYFSGALMFFAILPTISIILGLISYAKIKKQNN